MQKLLVILPEGGLAGKVTLSIGIAFHPKDGKRFEDLYHKADQALYYVKHHGKGTFHTYSADIDG